MVLQRKTLGNQARNEVNSVHLRALFTFLHRMRPRPQIHNRTFGFRTGKRQELFFGVSIGLRNRGRGHRGRAGHHLLQAVVRIVMIYVLRGYELMLDKHCRRHVPLV